MKKGLIFRFLRAAMVIAIAVAVFVVLIKLKPQAKRQLPADNGLLVEAIPIKTENINMIIEAFGTVKPREELKLVAEVPGRIVDINPSFKEGGFIKADKTLIKVDPRTYELEVERRKVQINQADADLKRLQQEVLNIKTSIKIAISDTSLSKAEFARLKELARKKVVSQTALDKAEQSYLSSLNRLQSLENQLALTGPTSEQLKSQRDLVTVLLKQAAIDLEKTNIFSPYDGWVQEKRVEVGQHVNAGQYLGSLYRKGAFDIVVRIPLTDLKWLPDDFRHGSIPEVAVSFENQGTSLKWRGRLSRTKAQMDERTRTLPLVVEIDDSSNSQSEQSVFFLRPGIFVTVRIQGKKVENAFVLPRYMVHAGDIVYVISNNRLRIRPVSVFRHFKDSVYIDKGLSEGDLVIKTILSGASEGMKVRLQ